MNHAVVSVILACHNAERTLATTLRSLAESDFTQFEVIVVDDASEDGSAAIAREALRAFPLSNLVELPENVGVAEARNIGLARAQGGYVWFVDADDVMPATALRDLHGAAQRYDADIVFARATETDASLDRVIPIDGLDLTESVSLSVEEVFVAVSKGQIRGFLWSKLFRRSLLPDNLFPAIRSQSDFMGLMKALEKSRNFVAIPAFVYDYVRSAESITTRRDSLSPLLQCERAFYETAAARGVDLSASDRAFYSGGLTLLAGLDSALRTHNWANLDRSLVRREFRRLSVGSIASVVRSQPRLGARIALARVSLTLYAGVYRVGRAVRGLAVSRPGGLAGETAANS
jgi:glycosyltransferase involved in cell wall biosynthesis